MVFWDIVIGNRLNGIQKLIQIDIKSVLRNERIEEIKCFQFNKDFSRANIIGFESSSSSKDQNMPFIATLDLSPLTSQLGKTLVMLPFFDLSQIAILLPPLCNSSRLYSARAT